MGGSYCYLKGVKSMIVSDGYSAVWGDSHFRYDTLDLCNFSSTPNLLKLFRQECIKLNNGLPFSFFL